MIRDGDNSLNSVMFDSFEIKNLRRNLGFKTQTEAAMAMGVNQSYFSRLENGQLQSVALLWRLIMYAKEHGRDVHMEDYILEYGKHIMVACVAESDN